MNLLKEMAGFAEGTVTRLIGQAQTIDPAILGLVFIFLVVFAAASRRILFLLGSTLLAIIAFFILIAPSFAPLLVAIGAGFGSLLITAAGMRFRQRQIAIRQELDILIQSVRKLESTEERRLLQSINAQSHQAPVDDPEKNSGKATEDARDATAAEDARRAEQAAEGVKAVEDAGRRRNSGV
jgi:hypothetical protein